MKNKTGLNIPDKVFKIQPKEPDIIPSRKSGALTSRTVGNPAESIKTYTPDVQKEPQPGTTNILSSRTETWPPPKGKTNLTVTKTQIYPAPREKRPEPFAFNNHEWQSDCALHTSVLQWINRIADEFRSLGFGNITREQFNSIAGGDLAEIEKKFFDDIEANIEKLQLTNEAMKERMREGTAEPFIAFKKSVAINLANITRSRQHWSSDLHFDISNYTLTDGVFYFDDPERERLKARFEAHLDSDVKKEFASKCAEVEKLLAELKEICQRNRINNVFGFRCVWEINPRTGELVFNKNILNFINK